MENARTKRPRPLADMPRIAGKKYLESCLWRLIIPSLLLKEVHQKWGESNGVGERSDPLGKVLAGFPARSPVNGYGPIEGSVAFVVVLSEYYQSLLSKQCSSSSKARYTVPC
ncbi:hypothetical protein L1987_89732 [Smallanthus sonchifolius]|nr:hypothetical protein L1987_89732 [Smallanthus sonchifolius]